MSNNMNEIIQMPAAKRHAYLLSQVVDNQQIWILTDDDGCVMLNSEDEDCVPVWPGEEFAKYWATADWAHCTPKAISLNDWHERWTNGLTDDEICVAIFPNPDEEGVVVFPDVFDDELRKQKPSGKG